MARRNRGERIVLAKDDIGVMEIGKDGAITVATKSKCEICGETYTKISADKSTWPKFKGHPVRQPNEWTSESILAHRLAHLSAAARRIVGKYVKQPAAVKEEIKVVIAELE